MTALQTPAMNNNALKTITSRQANHYRVVPVEEDNQNLTLLTDQLSLLLNSKEEIELVIGKSIILKETDSESFTLLLQKNYPTGNIDEREQVTYYHGESDAFLHHLIEDARKLKSSDIHIEAYEGTCRLRLRIDGQLLLRYLLHKSQYPSLINKIKILASLDIAEKRLPQDGRIMFSAEGKQIDIRVSCLPTLYGEKIVLRLLSKDTTDIDINTLGISPSDLENYLEGIARPNGMLLISGPTGSGKTTTLYASLKLLNKETRNILTVEDPIEYTLDGINQVQLKESIGLTFSTALKTFLRQDPDIIMLGEIRDADTAAMAIRAALTGHLVLSTIHTNSAWGIVSRLIDMGIPPFLIANTLNTAVAQRLVRLLCPDCKREELINRNKIPKNTTLPENISHHFVATGCRKCFNTGYRGRRAIYEVIPICSILAEKIRQKEPLITAILKEKKIKSLSENAMAVFLSGDTSMDEIIPILSNS